MAMASGGLEYFKQKPDAVDGNLTLDVMIAFIGPGLGVRVTTPLRCLLAPPTLLRNAITTDGAMFTLPWMTPTLRPVFPPTLTMMILYGPKHPRESQGGSFHLS